MILYRVRFYGQADWIMISISDGTDDEDGLPATISSVIGAALATTDNLHLQRMNDEGVWEDVHG